MTATHDAADMDTIALTQVELHERLAHPLGVHGDGKINDMDIAVQQFALIEGALLAMNLGLDVAGAQVVDEQTLHDDAALLDGA